MLALIAGWQRGHASPATGRLCDGQRAREVVVKRLLPSRPATYALLPLCRLVNGSGTVMSTSTATQRNKIVSANARRRRVPRTITIDSSPLSPEGI